MIKLAIYGKGGIGKSTIACGLSAAMAKMGKKVMQIGCDPKADSTALLRKDSQQIPTVLETMRNKGNDYSLEDIAFEGSFGVICCEAGGPVPGHGCAGRGIIAAMEALENKGAYDKFQPDVVIYDVLGDVVCGGFSMPMRKGYADKVFVVCSGEKMARYAAGNICMAVENFKSRGYAKLGGIILNRRNVPDEDELVENLAKDFDTKIIGAIDRSEEISKGDMLGKSVFELFAQGEAVKQFEKLAQDILNDSGGC